MLASRHGKRGLLARDADFAPIAKRYANLPASIRTGSLYGTVPAQISPSEPRNHQNIRLDAVVAYNPANERRLMAITIPGSAMLDRYRFSFLPRAAAAASFATAS